MDKLIFTSYLPPPVYVCYGQFFNNDSESYYYSWETANEACRKLKSTTLYGCQILNMKKEVVGIIGVGMFYDKKGNWLGKR